ncbi:hypothetical protein G9447_18660 [Actinopolyspora sp. BKK1]|uniref:PH domain-containing protein n=1 Tax=Actinopolyspora saharensis TaxID=995062 RepID=A0A1H1EAH0_9ACTN|nr:hypothetical protein [Actinopolyspora sp. BKK2]NHE78218.1 hypothetical protein [Actinopolyspora sp. BKK1]SDQ85518.1 hypothetical protein SAMN04489718_2442 [Actinopolyspora saharensis]
MSHTAGLPPKPDPHTGEPRPPRAPLEPEWKDAENKRPDGANKAPRAPEGESPALEWFCPSRGQSFSIGVTISLVVLAFGVLRDGGLGWMTTWWLWLFVVPWPFVTLLAGRNTRMSAGADWFRYGKKGFIRTYELTSVKVTTEGASRALRLNDAEQRTLSVQLNDIQRNRELWDLVYNGILHSVRGNGAETNKLARTFLDLDNPLRFRGE